MKREFGPNLLCVLLVSSPLAAQTVELSKRTFWLGEEPSTMDDFTPFFAPRRIPWIEEVIDVDPVLQDTVIHVEFSHLPASEWVSWTFEDQVEFGSDRLAPQFDLPDHVVFGTPNAARPSHDYFPRDPGAGYLVRCGLSNDRQSFSLCVLYATYPPDDHIRLKARLYYPDNPADRPTYFRDVAERMRELAYCLDVTEETVDVPSDRPNLSGCAPEVISKVRIHDQWMEATARAIADRSTLGLQ